MNILSLIHIYKVKRHKILTTNPYNSTHIIRFNIINFWNIRLKRFISITLLVRYRLPADSHTYLPKLYYIIHTYIRRTGKSLVTHAERGWNILFTLQLQTNVDLGMVKKVLTFDVRPAGGKYFGQNSLFLPPPFPYFFLVF